MFWLQESVLSIQTLALQLIIVEHRLFWPFLGVEISVFFVVREAHV
jgi:hypothetical protein